MAREKTKDLISQMVPQTPHEQPTEDPQTPHESTTTDPRAGPMQKYHIRMNPGDWETLKRYFAADGLTISAGIRSVLKQFIRDKAK